jgi:ethanolamine utilization microcompartment shell protein EutL
MQHLTSKNEAQPVHGTSTSLNASESPEGTADQVVVFITGTLSIEVRASVTAPIEALNENATYFFQLDELQMTDSTIALSPSGPALNFVLNTSTLNMTNSNFELSTVSNTEIRAESIDMCS